MLMSQAILCWTHCSPVAENLGTLSGTAGSSIVANASEGNVNVKPRPYVAPQGPIHCRYPMTYDGRASSSMSYGSIALWGATRLLVSEAEWS